MNMEDLASEFIFSDARKGNKASEDKMEEVFNTNSVEEIAKTIVLKGDVQLTTEQRHEMQEKKRKRIVETIAKNAMSHLAKILTLFVWVFQTGCFAPGFTGNDRGTVCPCLFPPLAVKSKPPVVRVVVDSRR